MRVYIITWALYREGILTIVEQHARIETEHAIAIYVGLLEKSEVTCWPDDFRIDCHELMKGRRFESRSDSQLVSLCSCHIPEE